MMDFLSAAYYRITEFLNQTRSKSFSFKHQGYCFLRGFSFSFYNYIGKMNHFTLDFQEGPIFNAEPFEKFFIVDHPKEDHTEREIKL